MRRIAILNDNEDDPGSSIATPSRLHKPVELFREFVWPPWQEWFRYDAPDKQLFKKLQKTLTP
jgi:hypothetical protein